MRRVLRDGWALLALAFGHLMLTFLFVTFIPLSYVLYQARSQPELERKVGEFKTFLDENPDIDWAELREQKGNLFSEFLKLIPWAGVAVLGSLIIYPFLGWWSGKLLYLPQTSGLLILGSVVSQKNVALVPLSIQHRGIADVALSLPSVLALIFLQFALLTGGIMTQRGQALLKESQSKE